ncbi:hypothetical protein [Streptomyces sviceus]|uniref:hypothetical protein n=1 Tax=Streptomyces sviceus TaxID=285530 RepID=UPI003332AC6E
MTATTAGPGRVRYAVPRLVPSGESRVGGQAGMAYMAAACWERAVSAMAAARYAVLLSGPPGPDGVTCTVVARRERAVPAVTVSSGRDRHAGLLPTRSGPACVGRQTGITHTVVARRATRPAGSGQ